MEDNGYDTIEFEPLRPLLKYSYVTKQDIDEEKFPKRPKLIAKKQIADKRLQQLLKSDKSKLFSIKQMEGIDVIHYKDKVYIPYILQSRIIAWYHEYLQHPQVTRGWKKPSKVYSTSLRCGTR